MADRTSAEIFGTVFKLLAERYSNTNDAKQKKLLRALAKEIYQARPGYDFCAYQMNCDEALVTLGLAREVRPGFVYLSLYEEGWSENA